MPCARATRATETPATSVASTIRRFSAILRRCRCGAIEASLSRGMTATCWEVSISAPSGHLSDASTSREWILLMRLSRRPSAYAYSGFANYGLSLVGFLLWATGLGAREPTGEGHQRCELVRRRACTFRESIESRPRPTAQRRTY